MNHCTQRRVFILQVIAGSSAAAASSWAHAAETEKLTEADPYAKSMGFRLDTTKVDQAKYPRHTAEQSCTKCQLWDGKVGDGSGPCSFYGGRLVPEGGWCRNFKVRKAA
jgi:High potential iron-sulfur protein